MDKELYYNVFLNNIKIGERSVNYKNVENNKVFIDSCFKQKNAITKTKVLMNKDDLSPEKIYFKILSNNVVNQHDIEFKNYRILLNGGEKEIWFRGKVYDSIQFIFMLPLLEQLENTKDNLLSINVISYDLQNIINFSAINFSQEYGKICYEIIYPSKFYLEYDSKDLFLSYYYSGQDNLEIKRVY